jgi:DNA-binding MarR family transcriptional regulator
MVTLGCMNEEKPPAENPARMLAELVVILDGIDYALPGACGSEKEIIEEALRRLRATLSLAPKNHATVREMRDALEELGHAVVMVLGAEQARLAQKSAEVIKRLQTLQPEKRRKIAPHNLTELHALLNKWPEVREEMLEHLPAQERRQLEASLPSGKSA